MREGTQNVGVCVLRQIVLDRISHVGCYSRGEPATLSQEISHKDLHTRNHATQIPTCIVTLVSGFAHYFAGRCRSFVL